MHEVQRLSAANERWLNCPWPGPDQEDLRGGWVWNPYSTERIRERTAAVFRDAAEAYAELVDRWFSRLRWRLNRAALLPARVVGRLLPTRADVGPVLSWYFEPLPLLQSSSVDITIGDKQHDIGDLEPVLELIRTLRPAAVTIWPSLTSGILEIFDDQPVSRLVYNWLTSDLRDIKWLP